LLGLLAVINGHKSLGLTVSLIVGLTIGLTIGLTKMLRSSRHFDERFL